MDLAGIPGIPGMQVLQELEMDVCFLLALGFLQGCASFPGAKHVE